MRTGVLSGAMVLSWGVSAEERVPLGEVAHIHGVAFDPQDPLRVLLATHFGLFEALPDGTAARISESRDDFMGFTAVPGDDDLLLASCHPETDGNLGFVASSDGGTTWRQVSEGAMGPVDFHALTISRVDQQVLYGLYRGIQASQDGGATWQLVGPGPEGVIDLAASAAYKDRLFAATGTGLLVSGDGGSTWPERQRALQAARSKAPGN